MIADIEVVVVVGGGEGQNVGEEVLFGQYESSGAGEGLAEVTLAKWSPRGAHRLPMPAHHMEERLRLRWRWRTCVRASGRIRCRGIGKQETHLTIF